MATRTRPSRFNGATPFQAWRPALAAGGQFEAKMLQWGHVMVVRLLSNPFTVDFQGGYSVESARAL